MKGIISQTIDWITHPAYSEASPGQWLGGLVLILLVSFAWSTVVRSME